MRFRDNELKFLVHIAARVILLGTVFRYIGLGQRAEYFLPEKREFSLEELNQEWLSESNLNQEQN